MPTVSLLILAILLLTLALACSTPADSPPTLEPTRRTPIPTLNPGQVRGILEARKAAVEAELRRTPRPTATRTPTPKPWPTPRLITVEPTDTPTPWPTFEFPTPAVESPVVVTTIVTKAEPEATPTKDLFSRTDEEPRVVVETATIIQDDDLTTTLHKEDGVVVRVGVEIHSPEIRDFLVECAEANRSTADWGEWLEEIEAVQAPRRFANFWQATQDMYAFQDADGPNADSQAAYVRRMEAIRGMGIGEAHIMLDSGCLTVKEMEVAEDTLAAMERLDGGLGQEQGTTLGEYAQACADVRQTMPVFNEYSSYADHFAIWWGKLTPPDGMEGYHGANGCVRGMAGSRGL